MGRLTLPNRLVRWTQSSTPRGREIVLDILKTSYPVPIRSQELYERIRKEHPDEKIPIPLSPSSPPILPRYTPTLHASSKKKEKPRLDPPMPPHPDHPIRSYKYLKSVVLEELAQQRQVAKVHSMREPTPEELAIKNQRSAKGKKKKAANAPTVIINVQGMVDQWGWVLKTPEDVEAEKKERFRIKKALEGQKMQDPKQIEEAEHKQFEEEWGHLNVRRRRARKEKLEREDRWARLLENGRQQGRVQAEQTTA